VFAIVVIVEINGILDFLPFLEINEKRKKYCNHKKRIKLSTYWYRIFKFESKHPFQESKSVSHMLNSEKHPANDYQEKSDESAGQLANFIIHFE
jgi:hypothetical protein